MRQQRVDSYVIIRGRDRRGVVLGERTRLAKRVAEVQGGEARQWVQLGCLSAGSNEKRLSTKIAAFLGKGIA